MKDITQDDLEKRLINVAKRPGLEHGLIKVGEKSVGGIAISVIAGPCAVESREQIFDIANHVKQAGAMMLRGGVYKPITFPGPWKGPEGVEWVSPGEEGLKWMRDAGKEYGLPIVTEVMDVRLVEKVAEYADVLQIGARNMQNFPLLEEVGKTGKPVLLKRHPGMSLRDLLGAAEWVMANGNEDVILCERGVSAPHTHDANSRFLLDLHIIPAIKKYTHLPIIVDPSHGTFNREYVAPLAKAAIAAGADGILIDVHPTPERAVVDPLQALSYGHFEFLMEGLRKVAEAVGRKT